MSSRRVLLALVAAASMAASLTAAPAARADRRAEAFAKAAMKKASSDYLATNYDAAAARLHKAVAVCGTKRCAAATRAVLLRDLGTMQFRNGNLGAAKTSWAQALKLKPDIDLNPDYDSADLRSAWEEAKGGGAEVGEQPTGDFAHTPAAEQRVNTPLPVYVEYSGSTPLARVVVKYKGASMNDWGRVDMKRMGNGWGALVPCTATTKGVLRYWVQGFDDGGDPAANSGDPRHPYTVPIRDDISGEAPHFPGRSAPTSCTEDTECPPGLPGCAEEEKGTEGPAEEAPPAPAQPGGYARLWFGISGELEVVSLGSADDACLLDPATAKPSNADHYYCTNPDGSDFPTRSDGGKQNGSLVRGSAGHVDGGMQLGDVRVMASFDYALSPALLVGGRIGAVLNAYTGNSAVQDGRAFGPRIDVEGRVTYLFGSAPLTHVGFAPMAFAGFGMSEFDAHTTAVVSLNDVAGQQPVNVWKTDGPWFLEAGGGIRYAFSLRAAFTGALRVNGAFGGNGFFPTYGPEIGVQYGF